MSKYKIIRNTSVFAMKMDDFDYFYLFFCYSSRRWWTAQTRTQDLHPYVFKLSRIETGLTRTNANYKLCLSEIDRETNKQTNILHHYIVGYRLQIVKPTVPVFSAGCGTCVCEWSDRVARDLVVTICSPIVRPTERERSQIADCGSGELSILAPVGFPS